MRPFAYSSAAVCSFAILSTLAAPPAPAAAPAGAEAARPRGQPRAWEHESSDIPVNPRIHFGTLANGVRYAWVANPEPKERCYLRVHFNAGSLNEAESERGMAHFLEHMAFNGTKNFPPGTLVEWLQRRGLDFGAHTNAFTSFDQTVYMLDLPHSTPDAIREGLTVFRDFTDGLLLDPKEVDAEKGVIDGEERERDSAAARLGEKALERIFAGSLVAKRIPIGLKSARDAFTSDSIRAFWSHWYRPENVTVIVAGDLGDMDPSKLIEETFGSLTAPESEVPAEPELGSPSFEDRFFALYDAEIPTVNLEVARFRPYVDEAFSKERLLRDLPLDMARRMLNVRFSELARKSDTPFLSARVGDNDAFDLVSGEALDVNATPAKWKEALTAAEHELRRAVLYGFDAAELDEARARTLKSLDEAVEREPTRSSGSFAQELVVAAEERTVPTDAVTDRDLYAEPVKKLTVKECNEAFAKAWSQGTLAIHALGGLDLGADGGEQLRAAWEESQKAEVEKPAAIESSAFAYASDPEKKGAIASDETREDPAIRTVVFENGVTLHVMPTDFKARQILVLAMLGNGALTAGDAALRMVAGDAFGSTGVEAHDQDALRRLLAGHQAGVSFGVGEDAFSFSGGTSGDDLQLQFDLMAAYIAHPSWRDTGLEQFRRNVEPFFERLKSLPQGALIERFIPEIFSHDWHFTFPTLDQVKAVGMDQVRAWLEPKLANAPITVCVVGDVTSDAAVEAAARTFGLLPKRAKATDDAALRRVPAVKTGVRSEDTVPTATPTALVHVVFPATDGIQSKVRRELQFLGRVLNDRVRLEVREKLGASYSPQAGAQLSSTYPGNGMLTITAGGDPAKADELATACLDVAKNLAENGVTDDEIDRLKQPLLASLKQQERDNGFWLQTLARLHDQSDAVEDALRAETEYEAIDAATIAEAAKRYLDVTKASVLIVRPESDASPKNS